MKFTAPFTLLAGFVAAQADETCYLPIDVMFLQDTTGSFVEDLPNVVNQIPAMVAAILEQNPSSWFGVAEFKDKPYYPLGENDDFCYKLNGALTGDVDEFKADYSLLYASGGGDLPEAQFQALINIAKDPSVGWRPIVTGSRATSETGAHLVIVSTDAVVHLPGDIDKLAALYPTLPTGLPANPGTILPPSIDDVCRNYDYPDADQMKAALQAQNIYLAILTPEDPDIVPTWKWINEELLGQPSDFYQFIASDSSDLINGVLKAIEAVTEYACTTTTPVPTTTTTTTPLSTTSTPTTTTTAAPTTTTTAAPTTTTTAATTTIAATTTTSTTVATTTTSVATTTTATTTLATTTPESTTTPEAECPPCPPCEPEVPECPPCCAEVPAVVIKINHRPCKLTIEYEGECETDTEAVGDNE